MSIEGRKVIILIGPMEIGGAERQALALAIGLRERWKARVEIWGTAGREGRASTLCDSNAIPWRIVTPGFIGPTSGLRNRVRTIKKLRAFTRELRAARPDVLMPFMTLPCVNTALVWRFTGARSMIWQQRSSSSELNGWWVESIAARNTPRFISNSYGGAHFLERLLKIGGSRITVIPNGIVRESPLSGRDEWRERLGVDSRCVIATMVANLHRAKDHATLLRAWALVLSRLPDGTEALLVFAGRFGDTHDNLVALARDLGILDHTRFLGEVHDVTGLLDASDICLLSAFREGLPNGVLEGMAAGLPVVASDIPAVREAVGREGHPWLFQPGIPSAAAELIAQMVTDAGLRSACGQAMRLRANSAFRLDLMIDRTAKVMCEELRPKTQPVMHGQHG